MKTWKQAQRLAAGGLVASLVIVGMSIPTQAASDDCYNDGWNKQDRNSVRVQTSGNNYCVAGEINGKNIRYSNVSPDFFDALQNGRVDWNEITNSICPNPSVPSVPNEPTPNPEPSQPEAPTPSKPTPTVPAKPVEPIPEESKPQKPVNPGNPDSNWGETPSKPSTNQGSLAELEAKMVDLVNAERAKVGAAPLSIHTKLTEVARTKSQDMIDQSYFSHNSPTYGSPFDMMKTFGISYKAAGENIAMNVSMEDAHEALMNSQGHRENILNTSYTSIGLGIVQDSNGYLYITQMFLG